MSYLVVRMLEDLPELEDDPAVVHSDVHPDVCGNPCYWMVCRVEDGLPVPSDGEVCAFAPIVDGEAMAAAAEVWEWIHVVAMRFRYFTPETEGVS
jgi:hypothetical protein